MAWLSFLLLLCAEPAVSVFSSPRLFSLFLCCHSSKSSSSHFSSHSHISLFSFYFLFLFFPLSFVLSLYSPTLFFSFFQLFHSPVSLFQFPSPDPFLSKKNTCLSLSRSPFYFSSPSPSPFETVFIGVGGAGSTLPRPIVVHGAHDSPALSQRRERWPIEASLAGHGFFAFSS